MKKISTILAAFACAAFTFVSCDKEPNGNKTEGKDIVVSISADENFNAENTAELTVSLSEATEKDIVVKLQKTDVQNGKENLTADYDKSVTVPAGQTEVKITVTADTFGLQEDVEYQTAISVASAEGAKVGEKNTVYINFKYEFVPEVNLYADAVFASDRTAKMEIVLSKAIDKAVVVTLEDDGEGILAYDKTITIAAGETKAEVVITIDIASDLAAGKYPYNISIASIENANKGKVPLVCINLIYPFSTSILIDGSFDDWNAPSVSTWTLPEGEVLYKSMKVLKLAADDKNLYVYMEFEDPGFDFNMPFDMYIDADGNPATGAIVASVDNDTFFPPYLETQMGLEYYLELALHDGDHYNDFHSWGGLYHYVGKDGEGVFSGLENLGGSYSAEELCADGSLADGIGRLEVKLSRKFFGMTGNYARIAVKNMDGVNNWAAYGLLPQGVVVDGTRQHVDMAGINMPNYVE